MTENRYIEPVHIKRYLAVVEIIIFALLAVYLVIRLWNVLGTNQGEHRHRSIIQDLDDVVIMPKDNQENAIVIEGEAQAMEFFEPTQAIQKIDHTFSLPQFLKGAERAYPMIMEAYEKGDIKKLSSLVGTLVLSSFEDAIKQRKSQNLTSHIEIKTSESSIQDMILEDNLAQIVVRFTSDQCIYTTDEASRIVDNTSKITNRIIDDWTFEKDITSPSKIWKLIKTHRIDL